MNVRSATEDDFDAITAVARATWHDTYDELDADTIDDTVDAWYTDDSMPLEAPGTVVLVCERDDELVGFTHAVAQGETADVLRMYVHPDHQGRGLGSRMMDELVKFLDENAPPSAYVNLMADVDGFYERWGFEETRPASKGMYLRVD